MNINFTGYKNTTSITQQYKTSGQDVAYCLNCQLTNDEVGQDLAEFQKLNKASGEKYKNFYGENFVNILVQRLYNKDKGRSEFLFELNGKDLPIDRNSLPFFTFLAKLTKNIQKMPDDNFKLESRYLYSNNARFGIIFGRDMFLICKQDYMYILKTIAESQRVKSVASGINNVIQDAMIDYLG